MKYATFCHDTIELENGLTSRIIQLTSFKYGIVNNTCNGGNFKNGDTSTQNIRKLLQLSFLFCFCFHHFVTELVNRRLVIGHGVPYRTPPQRLFMNDKQTKLNTGPQNNYIQITKGNLSPNCVTRFTAHAQFPGKCHARVLWGNR